jgi:hypothetical protein
VHQLVLQELNKPSVKRVRKNYIPPFEDPAWKKAGDARDIVKNGYEVTFASVDNTRYVGMTCSLPISLAGKRISISVQEIRGLGGAIQLSWYVDGVITNKNVQFSNSNKMENIAVPSNITSIFFKIQNNSYSSETYYYRGLQVEEGIYATDFEEMYLDGAKSLTELVPKKNIFDGLIEDGNINASTGANESGVNHRSINYIPIKQNKTYMMSKDTTVNWNPRIFYYDDKLTLISSVLLGEQNTPHTFTTPSRTAYIRWHDYATIIGTKVQIEEGSLATPFEGYELVVKPKSGRLVPQKNLIPNTDRFINSAQNAYLMPLYTYFLVGYNPSATDYVTVKGKYELELVASANNRDVRIIIPAKPNTTYRASCETNGDIHLFYLDANKSTITQTYNTISANVSGTTPSNCAYIMFSLTNRGLGAGTFYFRNWQLEEGVNATPFKTFKETNKSAHLVPKRNMLNPEAWVAGRIFDSSFKAQGYRLNGDSLIIMSSINGMVSQVVDVKPNTLYTVFHDSDNDGRRGVYIYSMSGTDLTPSAKISPNVFNSGNNDKVIIGMYKSTSANDLAEIDIVKPMMVEGATKVEFEPFAFANEADKLVPKKNMLPPLKYWSRTDGNAVILSDYEGEINPVSNYTGFKYASSIGLKRDTLYTISIDEITPNAVCFVAYTDSGGTYRYTTVNSGTLSKSFSIPASAQYYWLEMHFQTNRGKARFKNFMIQEGGTPSPFEPLEYIPEVKKRLVKAPYKKRSVDFKRETSEILDGVYYTRNSPRLKDGGMLIEEYTANVAKQRSGIASGARALVSKLDDYTHRVFFVAGTNTTDTRFTVPCTLVRDKTYTFSFDVEKVGGADSSLRIAIDPVSGTVVDTGTMKNGEKKHMSSTKTMTYESTNGIGQSINFWSWVDNTEWIISNIQVEEKPFATSWTDGNRKSETAEILNPQLIMDGQKGSIEIEWSADIVKSKNKGYFLFDTTNNRMFVNYDVTVKKLQVSMGGMGLVVVDETYIQTDNKLKIEWEYQNYVNVDLNGVQVSKTTTSGFSTNLGRMFMGTRYSADSGYLNGVMKKFVIKDKNGNVTFQL